ncbi:hypothetical protein GWI33_017071 [Rhynchophorus ferrugineus]|uniref:Uncharacterized protein n=1 Tax=Rhynchophorus ferrugineus TaxID=354439 RepID=A0A834M809_RHYFE|nr:hypothetical protein GWI33_017071 [Rhynchophorus ferrugineus]
MFYSSRQRGAHHGDPFLFVRFLVDGPVRSDGHLHELQVKICAGCCIMTGRAHAVYRGRKIRGEWDRNAKDHEIGEKREPKHDRTDDYR